MEPKLTHNLTPKATRTSGPYLETNFDQEPKSMNRAYIVIVAFAFVIGVLVTLQITQMTSRNSNTVAAGSSASGATANPEVVTRAAGVGLLTTADPTADPEAFEATNAVLLGLTAPEAPAAPTATAAEIEIADAVLAGRSDAEIARLLSVAAQSGLIDVPENLVTPTGAVDTRSLLFSIVEKATGELHTAPVVDPSDQGEGVEVRVIQQATGEQQFTFYTVSSGDSLAAISLRFYGSTYQYDIIFEANRDVLTSPDRIRVGQRLTIPTLDV
jgi:nucleoid-associated protein YgaU